MCSSFILQPNLQILVLSQFQLSSLEEAIARANAPLPPTDDYAIATGESYQLAELIEIEIAFGLVGLDWRGIGELPGLIR